MRGFYLLFLALSSYSCYSAQLVKMVVSDFPPYIEQQRQGNGAIAMLISAAFKKQGYRVEIEFTPWQQHYQQAQMNTFDASGVWLCSDERSAMFYCSETLFRQQLVLFYDKQSRPQKEPGLHGLDKLKVGYLEKYFYGADFRLQANLGVLNGVQGESEEALFRTLLKGEIDLVALPLLIGSRVIKSQFSAQEKRISYFQTPVVSNDFHVLFLKRKKSSRRLRIEFNKGLSKLKKSGEYTQIMNQYVIDE